MQLAENILTTMVRSPQCGYGAVFCEVGIEVPPDELIPPSIIRHRYPDIYEDLMIRNFAISEGGYCGLYVASPFAVITMWGTIPDVYNAQHPYARYSLLIADLC